MLWMRGGMWRSRALIKHCGMRSTAKYIHSHLSREVEALMVQLAARAHRTSEQRTENTPIYFKQATIFCLYSLIPSTLRATRALWPSRAGPPSSLRVQLKSDTSTFEYERHRACLSVKTSNDEPSHIPLHARTLRGVALSS